MTGQSNLAPLLQAFFTKRLMQQRQVSTHTIASYRDTCRLLLQFAQRRLHKAPSALALEDIERELTSETPDWTTPQRALDAISEGMRLLSWSPFSFRKAELGIGRSRELVVPFGGAGYVVLFEIVGNDVVVGAV